MAIHSHVMIWVHMVWGTYKHDRILSRDLRSKIFDHLVSEAEEIGVAIEKLNVQPEHIHVLFPLPSGKAVDQIAKSFKGESSRWINENGLIAGRFQWQRGYGAFSVSASQLSVVKNYIQSQDEHHRRKSFAEEYREWVQRYGVWDG